MKGIYLMYLVVPLLVLICWQQSSALTPKEQLTQLKQEVKKKREALAQNRVREESTSKRIQVCQRQAHEQNKRVIDTEKKISILKSGIQLKQRDLAVEKSAQQNRKQMWQSRLSSFYRVTMAETDVLQDCNPKKSNIYKDTVTIVVHAFSKDQAIIAAHDKNIVVIDKEARQLSGEKRQKVADRDSGKRELSRLEREKAEQAERLAVTRKERERLAEEIRAFEAKQKRLESLLASIQNKSRNKAKTEKRPTPPDETGGYRKQVTLPPDFPRFNLPVAGKIIRNYGVYEHPVWHTKTFNNGISIAANPGSPVRVIADGTVAFAGNLKGYGNMIIIEHVQEVFSVYGLCGSLMMKVGAKVGRGDAIASVGIVETDTPSLYFEIRSRGKTVNPAKWIIGYAPLCRIFSSIRRTIQPVSMVSTATAVFG
ncbi:MAG: murein hydrolase activator EnvC family protein [Desulfuromonadaceae bacterium]